MLLNLGVCKQFTGGTQNYKSNSKGDYIGRIFDLRAHKGVQFLFGGTYGGDNF